MPHYGPWSGYLALCFPTMLFKGLIHPLPSCSHKEFLSHTKFSVLKMCCTSSTRASSRASICSIPTLIQLPPGWHSSESYGRRWAWQPGAQLGAFHWEPANISLNPFFPLCSPIPTATVKSLLIMPFCLTHLSQNCSIWDGLKTEKKKRREAAHFASQTTPFRKANSVLIFTTIFSSFFPFFFNFSSVSSFCFSL